VRQPLRLSVCAIVAAIGLAPVLRAQQREDHLHAAPAVVDTAGTSALFPLSVADIPAGSTAADRYRILAHRIDSVSTLGSRLTVPSMLHDEIAQTTSRLVFFSQLEHNFGFGGTPATFAGPHSAYGSMDWLSFVTLAGFSGLARNSLLAPDESDQTVLGSLRTAGQWAGMATAAGGASWLISNLTRHSMCLGRLSCHRPTLENQIW
jgi:hypothetical protein